MKGLIVIFLVAVIFLASIVSAFARSGCCSHHGGVCGCGCCDGSPLSSTCAPYYPECNSAGSNTAPVDNTNTYTAPVVTPANMPVPPTATPIPSTSTPKPTITPTNTTIPSSNSQNTTQEVAGANASSNNDSALTILGLLLLVVIIGGIYFKNKKDKSKTVPGNL